MSELLDQLIREHGDEVAERVSGALGISRAEAERILPAAASVILDRFEPRASGPGGTAPDPAEVDGEGERSLDGILLGVGQQMSDQVGDHLGIDPELAARVIPVLVPVILRFLLRRVPYGSMAASVLSSTVAKQGPGALDAIAIRLAQRVAPGQDSPSVATRLGRWAGKWFPNREV